MTVYTQVQAQQRIFAHEKRNLAGLLNLFLLIESFNITEVCVNKTSTFLTSHGFKERERKKMQRKEYCLSKKKKNLKDKMEFDP